LTVTKYFVTIILQEIVMQKKQPVPEYYFAPGEWDRLGCGPLPDERNLELQRTEKNSAENKNGLDSSIDNR
jgi:hypothetical protein